MNTIEYIDAIKARYELTSDGKAAAALDITRAMMSRYRNGKDNFGDDVALKVAELLDLNPAVVLADMSAERAKSPAARSAWQAVSSHFRKTTSAILLSVIIGLSSAAIPSDVLAAGYSSEFGVNNTIHYAHL